MRVSNASASTAACSRIATTSLAWRNSAAIRRTSTVHGTNRVALPHPRRNGAVQRVVVLVVVLLEGQEGDVQAARGDGVEGGGELLQARLGHGEAAERIRVAAQADEHVGRLARGPGAGPALLGEQARQRQHDVAGEVGLRRAAGGERDFVGAPVAHDDLARPLQHVAEDAAPVAGRRRADARIQHVPRRAERLGDEVLFGGEGQVAPAAVVPQHVAAAADQAVEAAHLPQQPDGGTASPRVVPGPLAEQRHVAQGRQGIGPLAVVGALGQHRHGRMYRIHPADEAAQHELVTEIAHAVKAGQQ